MSSITWDATVEHHPAQHMWHDAALLNTPVQYQERPARSAGRAPGMRRWGAAGLGAAGAQGLVALASIWIPGVNAVTWAGVATTSAAVGIATTFVCILKDKINPDGVIVRVGGQRARVVSV